MHRCSHLGLALLVLLLAAPAAVVQASPPPAAPPLPERLTTAQWREDIRVPRDALETVHPGLYRYLTPAELTRELARLERVLDSTRTIPQAYLALAARTNRIRDGHTFPSPANQSRAVAARVFRETPRVPFYFRWLDGRMVVTRDASAAGVFPVGTEILSVNGTPAREILARLLPYTRTDGANVAKRIANLEVRPGDRWQAFDVLSPLAFSWPADVPWRFRVRAPGGGPARLVVAPAADASQRMTVFDSIGTAARAANAPPWTLRVDADALAVMTMPTWVTCNDNWDWQGWVDRAFAELTEKHATALVVDVRQRGGHERGRSHPRAPRGSRDAGWQLAAVRALRLASGAAASLPRHVGPVVRRLAPVDAARAREAGLRPARARLRGYVRHDGGARDAALRGRVFALVGAENSSATFEFALAVRERKLGILVGQPTGGNLRGMDGGAFCYVRLPNSRLEFDLPIIGFYATRPKPNAGIEPDLRVTVTPADVAAGRDPEMEAVRRVRRGVR